jgi:hypothetical protein
MLNKRKIILSFILLLTINNVAYCKWIIETVDSSGDAGQYSSIAIDTAVVPNILHISYFDKTQTVLKYAKWNGTSWLIQIVDTNTYTGYLPIIRLDKNKKPHIAYLGIRQLNGGFLKYAKWSDEHWNIEETNQSSIVDDFGFSFVLDSSDNPHCAYLRSYGLNYSTKKNGVWNVQLVDQIGNSGYAGRSISIVVDSANFPHIAYYDLKNNYLKYTSWNGNDWIYSVIDASFRLGKGPSLVIDKNNVSHVIYYSIDKSYYPLYYAVENSSWTIQKIADYGKNCCMVLDSNNNPCISFGTLKYIKYTGNSWINETIDNYNEIDISLAGDPYASSIAIDCNNNSHISYYNGKLKHAYSINNSTPPVLLWAGETNYITDGVNPEIGTSTTVFIFKIKYVDVNNFPNSIGYPKLHVLRKSIDIPNSPFTMNYKSGIYTTGAIYTSSITLTSRSKDYTYYVETYNSVSNIKSNVMFSSGPIVGPFLECNINNIQITSDTAIINYITYDIQNSSFVTYKWQYSIDNTNWIDIFSADITNNYYKLMGSSTVFWTLPSIRYNLVWFRMKCKDVTELESEFSVSNSFSIINNSLPTVAINQLADGLNGNINIQYQLADTEFDILSIKCEYSTNDGVSWKMATVQGSTSSIISANYYGSLAWQSYYDIPNNVAAVIFKIIPYDQFGPGNSKTSNLFTVNNSTANPPILSIDNAFVSNSTVTIYYIAYDINGDSITTTEWQYSKDNISWIDLDYSSILYNDYNPAGSSYIKLKFPWEMEKTIYFRMKGEDNSGNGNVEAFNQNWYTIPYSLFQHSTVVHNGYLYVTGEPLLIIVLIQYIMPK